MGFLGANSGTWMAFGLAIAWMFAFYAMRQPQTPNAFDLPQAQVVSRQVNALAVMYPSTIVNCGRAGMERCSNYCDQNARIRYIECTSSG